jgi:ADP-ribosylglycohydrolase
LAIALAAQQAALKGTELRADEVLDVLRKELTEPELIEKIGQVEAHLKHGSPPGAFAEALGCGRGVSGYMYHTVPAALYCWLRSPSDYRNAVTDVIALGGDTDTTGAIVGALAGAAGGADAIPDEWLSGVCEWPRSIAWMRELGAGSDAKLLPIWKVPALLLRNVFFMAVVLGHGFRRVLPPY